MEPDVPGSEDLPLWKSEGPAAHAEAMVHFQSRLSGRVIKHQARPSNPGAAAGKPPGEPHGVQSCSYHPLWVPLQVVGQRPKVGEKRRIWGWWWGS